MSKLNMFFFMKESISKSDAAWFYGGILTMKLLGSIVLWP